MTTDNALQLRNHLVDALKRRGSIQSPAVEAAFRTVPRHLFVPHRTAADAYRDDAIPTRWEHGLPTTSSSQPGIMAVMAEQLAPAPGHRVLEIGAGTGYNAAILRELVGAAGRVVTIDIQPDVAERAGAHLRTAGYADVEVIAGDGGFGHPAGAPYDRIIVTASLSDVAPPWVAQLGDGGRLLLPLRLGTTCLCVAFDRAGEELRSISVECCGFMMLKGAYGTDDPAADTSMVPMGDGLFLSAPGLPSVPLGLLQSLLNQPPRRVGGLIVPVNALGFGGGLAIYLALSEPGMINIFTSNPEAWGFHAVGGLFEPRERSLCLIRPDAVVVYGSDAAAQRMQRRAEEWVALGRPGYADVRVVARPAAAEQPTSPRTWVVRRRWYSFAVSFVEPLTPA
ncbi:MAG TPA: methyltransferase domain-containing protein [bacterium]|jgi:protein-L-isoaspartate(D-aspartate) O-methyltransferase|nr:methyltransferase domain-containing protein [bacterium]